MYSCKMQRGNCKKSLAPCLFYCLLFLKLELKAVKYMYKGKMCFFGKNPKGFSTTARISPKQGKVHLGGYDHHKQNINFSLHNHFTKFPYVWNIPKFLMKISEANHWINIKINIKLHYKGIPVFLSFIKIPLNINFSISTFELRK